MRKLLISLFTLIAFTACGTPKNQTWPAPYQSQFLCWDKPAEGLWEVSELCTPDSYLEWDGPGVKVAHDPNMDDAVVKKALRAWNAWLGFEMFVYVSWDEMVAGETADIIFFYDANPPSPRTLAMTRPATVDGKLMVFIPVYHQLQSDVAAHELGHALGLKHDHKNKSSIVYTYAYSGEPRDAEIRDVAALRRKYKPKEKASK